jgi:hypothetical protein
MAQWHVHVNLEHKIQPTPITDTVMRKIQQKTRQHKNDTYLSLLWLEILPSATRNHTKRRTYLLFELYILNFFPSCPNGYTQNTLLRMNARVSLKTSFSFRYLEPMLRITMREPSIGYCIKKWQNTNVIYFKIICFCACRTIVRLQ